jgi:two-component system chemotaxis sensor kinase CheA
MESEELQTLLAVFRAEAAETLDTLAETVEALRGTSPAGRGELIKTGLRLAHNLKGSSQSVGLEQAARLAHGLEDSLGAVKDAPTVEEDAIRAMLRDVSRIQQATEGADVEEAIRKRSADLQLPEASASRKVTSGSSVRVEAERIDRLMSFTGELLVSQAAQAARVERLERFGEDLLSRVLAARSGEVVDWEDLPRQLDELQQADRRELMRSGNLTAELKDAVKALRMVRLGMVAAAWRRTVRETADAVGRVATLKVSVGEIEIDKQVLDRLHDPLLHVLRNAVDHGLEPPDERERSGKSPMGVVAVSAEVEGTMVRIEISDDGRGVDIDRVVQVARERHLAPESATGDASSAEATALLFHDDLSTASKVTEISGRGIGLGVVQRAAAELGGRVDLVPRGRLGGATVAVTVPLSVLSTRELLVKAGRLTCAVPIESIERALRLDQGSIEQLEGAPAARLEGSDPLRIVWLSRAMGEEVVGTPRHLSVLVVRAGRQRAGIVVDDVLQQGEFVIQRLPWNLRRVPCISGAVVLADGSLAVPVDVAQVLARGRGQGAGPAPPARGRLTPLILVVDDSLTTRTLHRDLLAGAGYEVVVASNGAEAWELLGQRRFDLLVTDVLMSDVDGWELTQRVRQHPRMANLPVILVTTLGSAEDQERGVRVGANAYVVKGSYDQEQLLRAVASHV